jgi:hypothetical protein
LSIHHHPAQPEPMQFYTIHLPVKTYVRKYLSTIYGNPIIIDGRSEFSDVILAKLSSSLHSFLSPTDLELRLNRFTDRIDIKLPIYYWYQLENKLDQHNIVRINRYFENRFENDFCYAVSLAVSIARQERKKAIEAFAVTHGIDVEYDITFDALKKMEYRFRKEKEKNSKKVLNGLSRENSLFQTSAN